MGLLDRLKGKPNEEEIAILFDFVEGTKERPKVFIVPYTREGKFPHFTYKIGDTPVPAPKTFPPIYIRLKVKGEDGFKEELFPVSGVTVRNPTSNEVELLFDRRDVEHFLDNYVLRTLRRLQTQADPVQTIGRMIFFGILISGLIGAGALAISQWMVGNNIAQAIHDFAKKPMNVNVYVPEVKKATVNETQQKPTWIKS